MTRSSIQFWEMSDAPDGVLAALPSGHAFDWIALIPLELQDREVFSLIIGGPGSDTLYRHYLATGECVLAGTSNTPAEIPALLLAASEPPPAKVRSATAPGDSRGSGPRS
ncbi:MAG: hypothetical protein WA324_06115 [Bryobacteraceae bacterium]